MNLCPLFNSRHASWWPTASAFCLRWTTLWWWWTAGCQRWAHIWNCSSRMEPSLSFLGTTLWRKSLKRMRPSVKLHFLFSARIASEVYGWAHCVSLIGFTEDLIDEDELFPDDVLSNHHTDMVDNEPVINEARKSFMRYWKSGNNNNKNTFGLIRIHRYPHLHQHKFIGCFPLFRQISIVSSEGENLRCRSVRRHGCSQKKLSESQEKKKPQEVEKLIQAETAETGRVSRPQVWFDPFCFPPFLSTCSQSEKHMLFFHLCAANLLYWFSFFISLRWTSNDSNTLPLCCFIQILAQY